MRQFTTAATVILAFAGSLAFSACQRQPEQPADLVLVNGKILTVDPNDAVADFKSHIEAPKRADPSNPLIPTPGDCLPENPARLRDG